MISQSTYIGKDLFFTDPEQESTDLTDQEEFSYPFAEKEECHGHDHESSFEEPVLSMETEEQENYNPPGSHILYSPVTESENGNTSSYLSPQKNSEKTKKNLVQVQKSGIGIAAILKAI